MARSKAEKEKALALYIEGRSLEQVALVLGLPSSTVHTWKQKGIPRDWDAARKEIEDKARTEINQKLLEKRIMLGTNHFDDLELARTQWKRAFFEDKVDKDGQPVRDDEGRVVRQLRQKMSAGEIAYLCRAYQAIQLGQRTVFGLAAYTVENAGQDSHHDDIPQEIAEAIDRALVAGSSTVTEEVSDDEAAEEDAPEGA